MTRINSFGYGQAEENFPKKLINFSLRASSCTVSGQNTIGIYITPLVVIQPTDVEQNAVKNNWLLKLQPAVKLQSWQKSDFHQIE